VNNFHQRTWIVALIALAAVPFALNATLNLPIGSAGVHEWLPSSRPEKKRYDRFQQEFGSDQSLLISWDGAQEQDARVQVFADKLRESVLNAGFIDSVVTTNEVLESLQSDPLNLSSEQARTRLIGNLLGADGTCAVFLTATPLGVKNHGELIQRVQIAADETKSLGRESLRMVGSIYEAHAIDVAAAKSLSQLVAPSSIAAVLVACFLLRSWRYALIAFLLATAGQLAAVSLVYYGGFQFSAVLIVLPTLIFMLTLSGAIHLVNYQRHSNEATKQGAGWEAVRHGFWPCVLSSGTTMLGMGSLLVSELSPIREFGGLSGVSLGIATAMLLVYFPYAIGVARPPLRSEESAIARESDVDKRKSSFANKSRGYLRWQTRHAGSISIVSLLSLAVAVQGLSSLKASTKFCDLFPPDDPVSLDMAWFESHLGPIASVEVLLKFPRDNSVNVLDQVRLVSAVQSEVSELPDVGGIASALLFLPEIEETRGVRGAVRRGVLKQRIESALPQLQERGFVYLGDQFTAWRLSAKVSALEPTSYREATDTIERATIKQLEETASEATLSITGLAPVMHETQIALLSDLGNSFMSAFLLITPVMMWVVQSIRGGLLVMLPNVLPVTLAFGTMGWLGYSLDIAGILTASVALGIAVDDTLHFICWYRQERSQGLAPQQAVERTFAACAPAMIQTTVIACSAMIPFLFAEFNPTQQFARLMISILSLALVGDLLLLPALLQTRFGHWVAPNRQSDSKLSRSDT
jgi:predicted RND superfamily exporter protein